MTPDELYEGTEWAWRETYKPKNIIKRLGLNFNIMDIVRYSTNIAYMHWADKFKTYTKERLCDNSDIPD